MIEGCGVRPEGYISEPNFDISLNWMDIRGKFGYTLLYSICYRYLGVETHCVKSY